MAISINTYNTHNNLVNQSHCWGFPDLPEGTHFPCRGEKDEQGTEDLLTFICQIRMEDLRQHDPQHLLPAEGMLYFFADLDYFLGQTDAEDEGLGFWDKTSFKVIYSTTLTALHTHEVRWADGTPATLPAEALTFNNVADKHHGHKLLGTPFFEEVSWEAEGMISLLQIDEDERWGLRLFDMGNLNFLITPEDLALRNFSNVKLFFHSL